MKAKSGSQTQLHLLQRQLDDLEAKETEEIGQLELEISLLAAELAEKNAAILKVMPRPRVIIGHLGFLTY